MIKKCWCRWSGSGGSKKALELACELGKKQESTLHVRHIAPPSPGKRLPVPGAAVVTVQANPEKLKETGKQVVISAEEIARGRGLDKVSLSVVDGDPAARIIDYAKSKKIGMIVMGTRGLSDVSGLSMGSVSHKVSHLAPCTCVAVQ